MTQHIWHPCSQMKDYETFQPLNIVKARGEYLYLENGQKIIDAISSWWCKSLGHNHPHLKKALLAQLEQFEHVILANTTNSTIQKLSEKLVALMPALQKIFFAGDGSCAVEIALKMSLHWRKIHGQNKKTKFMTLRNAYHGETAGAMSVSDLGIYRHAYQELLFDTIIIDPIPYVSGVEDPLWHDASEAWNIFLQKYQPDEVTAIIVEPIIQGAAGMQIYSADFLKRLSAWAKQNNIHLIADEIMTGFGRTGKMFACEHANITPDFLCIGKGLTSGWLPLSVVMTHDAIYQAFYDDYEKGKSFLHSHTFSGNALAASIALAVLEVFEQENILAHTNKIAAIMRENMQAIANDTKKIHSLRSIGAIVAADLSNPNNIPRLGYQLYQKAIKQGVLLRPLGNTIYWLPPLNTAEMVLTELKSITQAVLLSQ